MSDSQSCAGAHRIDSADERMAHSKQQSFERMHLQAGQRILDVGCGTGDDTLALATWVGAQGTVHGVDYDAAMIALAWQRCRAESVAATLSYHHANATALPWPDHYFDASRSDRIYQHLLDPVHAFDEQLRVTRPGGRVVVISGDWATLSIDSDEPEIESRYAHFVATLAVENPISGHCLRSLFAQRGVLDVQVDVFPIFCAATETSDCWQQSIEPAAAQSGLFVSANVVVISGCKPPVGV